ncbi:MAG TPA: SIS domain-containing protein [Jiangellaceae bacterium]
MFFDGALDDPAELETIDPALREIALWGSEVRRADAAADAVLAEMRDHDRPRAVVAGGADGRLFRAVLEPICPVPFVAWPHPGLPGWAGPLDLVVIMSAAGDEEDLLSAVAEAVRRGCSLLVAAPEGSAVAEASHGSSTTLLPAVTTDPTALAVPVLRALHLRGLGPEVAAEPVASLLDDVAVRCGAHTTVDENPAKEIALAFGDDTPVVYGGSVLAARAARRVAEALRAASGRAAIAGTDHQLVPLLEHAPEEDIFADPFDGDIGQPRPSLLVLDDGMESATIEAARERVLEAAEKGNVRVHTVDAAEGPEIGRFAALLATGRFAAAYLALGLGRRAPS